MSLLDKLLGREKKEDLKSKLLEGIYREIMPQLVREGYQPLTTSEIREEHPEIEWRKLAGLRDILHMNISA